MANTDKKDWMFPGAEVTYMADTLTAVQLQQICREMCAGVAKARPDHPTLIRDVERAAFLAQRSPKFREFVASLPSDDADVYLTAIDALEKLDKACGFDHSGDTLPVAIADLSVIIDGMGDQLVGLCERSARLDWMIQTSAKVNRDAEGYWVRYAEGFSCIATGYYSDADEAIDAAMIHWNVKHGHEVASPRSSEDVR